MPKLTSFTCLALLILCAACTQKNTADEVGYACTIPTSAFDPSAGPQISTAAGACTSGVCLMQPPAPDSDGPRGTCTISCESDGDCATSNTSLCASGYVCAIPFTVGDFCCKKLCVCASDLVVGENASSTSPTQVQTPYACDPVANPSAAERCSNIVSGPQL